jgi:choline-sulfatase
MLAGRRPSAIGVYDNAAELPASTPTIAHQLRAGGYHTVLAGKMHFVGPDQLHGFEERLTTDVYPAGFDWTPDWRLPSEVRLSWYHNMSGILDSGVREAAMQTAYDDEVAFRAVERIRELAQRPDRRPFFLAVSFTNPHDPWEVRARHYEAYAGREIDPPAVPAIPRAQADPHSLRLRDMSGLDERPLSATEILAARRAYYAAITYMDERVGEVLAALADTGLRDETVVAFTADHGEMGGERGLWFKMSFYDGSARVPLIVAGPGVAPGRVAEPVSQLDLAPTLADLADAAPGAGYAYEGRSLAAALGGGPIGPAPVVSEYLAEGVVQPAVMLRRGAHKLIRCAGDPDLLYDVDADPLELRDLAGTELDVLAELSAEADARWDLGGLRGQVLASQARRRAVAAALAAGTHTPWDHQPFIDASRQYVRGPDAWHPRPGVPLVPGSLPGNDSSASSN